jgi:hypothetical protein
MDGYGCALEFDTTTSDFVRGVEIGRLWEILKHSEGPVEEIVHASNAEMILRVAEAAGRAVDSDELDDIWLMVRFAPA